ncbi:TIGR01440 family protein [Halalkalibacter krulwichiae]|uniref:UPF0340 protein BkAM31D_24440 n=1 Tax=Halalkalibacter krulwichiae TaxID=199441 RepID=A0A1X9MKE0_9BACI|nr:TIGR01440 family protein [Halalkalibacter krulwichiae]ARK32753.1 hypothetical protein BkAM31D_24440 [Halalkalibacter krulwichiae]
MDLPIKTIQEQLNQLLDDLDAAYPLTEDTLLVIGTSTSEVAGHHIGTNGSNEIAEAIYQVLAKKKEKTGMKLAFQCCEHLNRALVVEKETARNDRAEVVAAVPIRKAGGAMAAYAYRKMNNPVLVEAIQADVGIDIGNTLIGMHLKKVAVPLRSEVKKLGEAHVTLAFTRPKLIGGMRAVYEKLQEHE